MDLCFVKLEQPFSRTSDDATRWINCEEMVNFTKVILTPKRQTRYMHKCFWYTYKARVDVHTEAVTFGVNMTFVDR